MKNKVTISKEVFDEISELLGLADVITTDIVRLGLDKNPDDVPNNSLIFTDELSGNAWSNELLEILRRENPTEWKTEEETTPNPQMIVKDNLVVMGQVEYDNLIKSNQYSEYKAECAIQMVKALEARMFPPVYDADGCEDASIPNVKCNERIN